MIGFGLLGLLGYVLPVFASIFIVVMIAIHRRGGARVIGIIGSLLVIAGTLLPPVIGFLGIGPAGMTAEALLAGDQPSPVAGFISAVGPGVLTGIGIIGVCCAAVSGAHKKVERR